MSKHFVGRNARGDRMFVEITLKSTNRAQETTDHRSVKGGQRISITGFVIEHGRRNASAAGQCIDDVASVTEPAPGWTRKDIATLIEVWREWHLNDMKAGCIHSENCPDGYRIGSAWLYKEPTDDALRKIKALQALPAGKVPSTY
jgi:hypothetical protein